jgi:hypothetical protein
MVSTNSGMFVRHKFLVVVYIPLNNVGVGHG